MRKAPCTPLKIKFQSAIPTPPRKNEKFESPRAPLPCNKCKIPKNKAPYTLGKHSKVPMHKAPLASKNEKFKSERAPLLRKNVKFQSAMPTLPARK